MIHWRVILKISSFLNLIFNCLQIINFSDTANYVTSILPPQRRELQSISRLTARAASLSGISSLSKVTLWISAALNCFNFPLLLITMYRNLSLNSTTDSDVFYVEHSLQESSPIRNNTPAILNSTQLSGAMQPEAITISSVASPEPQIVTIESDSSEPISLMHSVLNTR